MLDVMNITILKKGPNTHVRAHTHTHVRTRPHKIQRQTVTVTNVKLKLLEVEIPNTSLDLSGPQLIHSVVSPLSGHRASEGQSARTLVLLASELFCL